jgi:hypothetical protein
MRPAVDQKFDCLPGYFFNEGIGGRICNRQIDAERFFPKKGGPVSVAMKWLSA